MSVALLTALASMAGPAMSAVGGMANPGGMSTMSTMSGPQRGLFNQSIRDVSKMMQNYQPSGLPTRPTHSASTRGVADKGREMMGNLGQKPQSSSMDQAKAAMGGTQPDSLPVALDKGYTSLVKNILAAINA